MNDKSQITIEHFHALIMGKITMQLELDLSLETAKKLDKIANELISFAQEHEIKFTKP